MIGANRRVQIQNADRWAGHIAPAENTTIEEHRHGAVGDTVALIKRKILNESWQVAKLAKALKAPSETATLKAGFDFIMKYIAYEEDAAGVEQVRSPARLFADKKGDCDCYTVFLGALMREWGIPFTIRLSKNNSPGQEHFNHVYPVAKTGGRMVPVDPVVGIFGKEARYYHIKDHDMIIQSMNGLETTDGILRKKDGTERKLLKVVQKVNKVNPVTALFRQGLLLALDKNLFNISGRARIAYLSPAEAASWGIPPDVHQKIKRLAERIENTHADAGGDKTKIKAAILGGNGNKDKAVLGFLKRKTVKDAIEIVRKGGPVPAAAQAPEGVSEAESGYLKKISDDLDQAFAPIKTRILADLSANKLRVAERLAMAYEGVEAAGAVLAIAIASAAKFGIGAAELEGAVKQGAANRTVGVAPEGALAAASAFLASIASAMKSMDLDKYIAARKAKKEAKKAVKDSAAPAGDGFKKPGDDGYVETGDLVDAPAENVETFAETKTSAIVENKPTENKPDPIPGGNTPITKPDEPGFIEKNKVALGIGALVLAGIYFFGGGKETVDGFLNGVTVEETPAGTITKTKNKITFG